MQRASAIVTATSVLAMLVGITSSTILRADPAVPGSDSATVPAARSIAALLRQPENEIDLARVKVTLDKMIDPSIDVAAGLNQIDGMAAQVRGMPGFARRRT